MRLGMVCLPVPPLLHINNWRIINHLQLQLQALANFSLCVLATYRSRSSSHRFFAKTCDPLRRLRWLLFLIDPRERPAHRLRPRVDITHRGLDGVVLGDVPQRKSVRVPSRLGQKRVAQSVKSSIRIESNLITGKFFPETPHFGSE